MLNSLETFAESGRRAGTAMRQGDGARYQEEARHYVRMYNTERAADRPAAERAYRDAYKAVAMPSLRPFT